MFKAPCRKVKITTLLYFLQSDKATRKVSESQRGPKQLDLTRPLGKSIDTLISQTAVARTKRFSYICSC